MHPVPGFYIAHCPLLEAGLGRPCVKVGHSGDLRARLHESAYVTCFPPDSWRYTHSFELDTKLDAAALEFAVLHCMRDLRLAPRELVTATAERAAAVASAAAAVLGLTPRVRLAPAYPARAPAARAESQAAAAATLLAASARVHAVAAALEAATELPAEPAAAKELPAELPVVPAVPAVPAAATELPMTPAVPALPAAATELPAAAIGLPAALVATPCDEFDLLDVDAAGTIAAGTGSDLPASELVLRDYQHSAAADIVREFQSSGRTILQMACRCGKTAVAFSVAAQLRARRILFLVPGLSLLRQTVQKLAGYTRAPLTVLAIGSDPAPIPVRGRALAMTTDLGVIATFLRPGRASGSSPADESLAVSWTVCTYQSSPLLAESLQCFDLVIADEAHRMTGARAARTVQVQALEREARFLAALGGVVLVAIGAAPKAKPRVRHGGRGAAVKT